VTVESVEAAVAAAVQASLPAAIDAANAGYGDGVHIPAIVTWRRGIVVDVEEVDITHFPTLAVGTYREDPQKVGEAAMWGSEIQCPVVVAFVMLGPNGQTAHLRAIRLVDCIKRVLRGLTATLSGGVVTYWPYDLAADWDPPKPFGKANLWYTIGMVEAATVRLLEGEAS
jgi:hypothetical protein